MNKKGRSSAKLVEKRQREEGENSNISILMDKNCVDLLLCLATHTYEVATKLTKASAS